MGHIYGDIRAKFPIKTCQVTFSSVDRKCKVANNAFKIFITKIKLNLSKKRVVVFQFQ